ERLLREGLEVGGDGGLAHVHGGDDLTDVHRHAAAGQQRDDLNPGRVSERLEPRGVLGRGGPVERLSGLIHRSSTIPDERPERKGPGATGPRGPRGRGLGGGYRGGSPISAPRLARAWVRAR